MDIPLTEPTAPPGARYIYVNPKSNHVHVLMPVVGGEGISTDNTCASVRGLQEFFGLSRDVHQIAFLDEVKNYQNALEFDLSLLDEGSEVYQKKSARLGQIRQYIKVMESIQDNTVLDGLNQEFPYYPEPLQTLMKRDDSNLYSMVLRPRLKDDYLRFVNPVFTVKRDGADDEQVLYQALKAAYKDARPLDTKAMLVAKVAKTADENKLDFESKQQELEKQIEIQLGEKVDLRQDSRGNPVTKDYIDTVLMFDENTTTEEYIDGIIGLCAPDLFNDVIESPFYARKDGEDLSIITQFFLGSVNIHCEVNGISSRNFGEILDNDKNLSEKVADIVISMTDGDSIEDVLFEFFNDNQTPFGLTRPLNNCDKRNIKKAFFANYRAIKESDHFDEFAILDRTKHHPFIHHQGSICLNFSEFIRAGFPELEPEYFNNLIDDFKTLKGNISNTNPHIHASVEIRIEDLFSKIQSKDQLDVVLKKLSPDAKAELLASPQFKKMQVSEFLTLVAQGKQGEAEQLLKDMPAAEELLLARSSFTDYQGRTFECSGYEYAYWAKDTHMRRMLERYMDADTKSEMFNRIVAIEEHGLTYQQNGETRISKHFDLKPLKDALQAYVDGFNDWHKNDNWDEIGRMWIKVGKAQRDVPVHAINEYCRSDRSFDPCPDFNDSTLPRQTTFFSYNSYRYEQLYPLMASDFELGVDFSLTRVASPSFAGGCAAQHSASGWPTPDTVGVDLAAIRHLDEVRTNDLKQSLENLKPQSPTHFCQLF